MTTVAPKMCPTPISIGTSVLQSNQGNFGKDMVFTHWSSWEVTIAIEPTPTIFINMNHNSFINMKRGHITITSAEHQVLTTINFSCISQNIYIEMKQYVAE